MRHHNSQRKPLLSIPLGVDLWADDDRREPIRLLMGKTGECLANPHGYAVPLIREDIRRQLAQLIGAKAARTFIARTALDVWRQLDGLLWLLMLLGEQVEEVGWSDVLPAWSPWAGRAPPVVPEVTQRQ
jgi:hypothetical protein